MSKRPSMLSMGIGSFIFYDYFVKERLNSSDSFTVFWKKFFYQLNDKKSELEKEKNKSSHSTDVKNEIKNKHFLSTITDMIPVYFPIFKVPIETIIKNKKNFGLFLLSTILYVKRDKVSGMLYVSRNKFTKTIGSLKNKINQKFAKTQRSIGVLLKRVTFLTGEVKKTQQKIDNVKKDTENLKEKTGEINNLAKTIKGQTSSLQKHNKKIENKVDHVKEIVEKNGSRIDRLKQYLAPNVFESTNPPKSCYKLGERSGDVSDLETEVGYKEESSPTPSSSSSDIGSTGEVVNDDEENLLEEKNGGGPESWFSNIKLPTLP